MELRVIVLYCVASFLTRLDKDKSVIMIGFRSFID